MIQALIDLTPGVIDAIGNQLIAEFSPQVAYKVLGGLRAAAKALADMS